jgi:preprotein translocase SecE subunit
MANGSVVKATSKPKGEGWLTRFGKFVREAYIEAWHKSAWPTWTELRKFTGVVIFAVLVVAAWIAGLDFVLKTITDNITGGGMAQ